MVTLATPEEDIEKQSLPYDDVVDIDVAADDNDEEPSYGRCTKIIRKIASKSKSLTPFLIIVVYSLIGAGVFIAFERQTDVEKRSAKQLEIETARNSTISVLMNLTAWPMDDREIYLLEAIIAHEETVGFSHSSDTVWTFWNAILYAGTIYTTIGYGNIACATFGGRLASIFYAIIGIPLALTTLNDLGKLMLNIIEKISNCFHRCRFKWASRKKRRQRFASSYVSDGGDAEEQVEPTMIVLDEWGAPVTKTADAIDEEEEEEQPPVLGAVIATVSWLFVCAGIFCIWEDWDYFTSFYFFFVSLSTIGFGDVVPAYPEYMVMNFALVFIGLALVSVCIGVVQQKLQDMYMKLLLNLLKEYQIMMEQGGNEFGASMGMAQMWSKNKKAKWLLPLLGKDKRNMVMQKFQEEAKAHNIELPMAFTSIDKKSGLPAIIKAVEKDNIKEAVQEWVAKVEEENLQQKAMASTQLEEVAAIEQQTSPKQSTAPQPDMRHMTSQTSLNVYAEMEQQTYSSSFQLREATSQTALYELQHRHMQTASSLFQLREAMSQTAIMELEARAMQTLSSLSLQQDCSAQTIIKQYQEQPMQTTSSYFHSKESESQTLAAQAQNVQSQTNLSSFQTKSGTSQTYSSSIGSKDILTQSLISSFAMKNRDSQTDIRSQTHSNSQTDLSAFQRRDYGGQTIERQLNETLSQTDISSLSAVNDFGSQTVFVGNEQFAQTDVQQHNFFASQTDLSSFHVADNNSQTFLDTQEHGLQHGSSLAELSSVASQISYPQNDSTSQTLISTFQMRATQSQTALDTQEGFSQTQIVEEPQLNESQSQTELNVREVENQTSLSYFTLHNADSQTFVNASDQGLQTVYEVDESECQTFMDTSDEGSQIGSEFFMLNHADSQTTLITDEATVQTASSFFDVQHFGSQTTLNTEETHAQTTSSFFDVQNFGSQTTMNVEEAMAQTTSSYLDVQHFGSQTSLSRVEMSDQSEQACMPTSSSDVGVQTGILTRVEHMFSKKLGKSKDLESKDSFILTKRKSLKKIDVTKSYPMAMSDDEGHSRGRKSSSEEETNEARKQKERLLWTPLDGRHVEKQLPVSALKKKFEKKPPINKEAAPKEEEKQSKRRSSADPS